MLFEQTQLTGLFCFVNKKAIFEGVHKSFKFVVLTWQKGGHTESFPAAFMRHEVEELNDFPKDDDIRLPLKLIHRSSPTPLSVMEFKNDLDVQIIKKMLEFPLLGEHRLDSWNVKFCLGTPHDER